MVYVFSRLDPLDFVSVCMFTFVDDCRNIVGSFMGYLPRCYDQAMTVEMTRCAVVATAVCSTDNVQNGVDCLFSWAQYILAGYKHFPFFRNLR